MLQIVHFLFSMPGFIDHTHSFSMRMRLRMLKHCVGKGRHVMKPLHVCLIVLQYYAIVATGRAGYVLYGALVEIENLWIIMKVSSNSRVK